MALSHTRRSAGRRRHLAKRVKQRRTLPSQAQLVIHMVAASPAPALCIASPADVAALLGAEMGALAQEQLRVLLLDMFRGMASQAHTCATLGDRQPGASPRLLEVRRR